MLELPSSIPFRRQLERLDGELNDPNLYNDNRRAAAIGREHQRLTRLVGLLGEAEAVATQIREAEELTADEGTEAELREMAEAELPELRERRGAIEDAILPIIVPPDPSDARNTVVEIRAGAGGDEASLFAADLFRMYQRFAENQGWRVEPMSSNPSESGGFKEVIFSVTGDDVYRLLKFESGVHRVQRVPVTEASGRIHTSTATVAVLPEAEEVDVVINPEELEITVTRASGPGGQGVNTTDSAVQILHKPTGLIVNCADERSQLKNKNKALRVLRSRLLQQREEEERARYASERRSQIGTGDRSERIRTYNFPQSRVTDHRIGLTLHNLDEILAGDLRAVIDQLHRVDAAERLDEVVRDATREGPGK